MTYPIVRSRQSISRVRSVKAHRRGFVSSAAHWWHYHRSKAQNQLFLCFRPCFWPSKARNEAFSCFGNALVRAAAEIYGIPQLKAGSAAWPKGCSACFVLVLVGIVMRAVQENRRTMSQLLKHSGIARAQHDRGRGKDEKYPG